ncbi:hypothetical protein N7471_001334 [Penicillium samsonianum]|uniref:uncharacterized protein n=1 Tax=Penicillium samsonianum TaxID=1882272 RepID=UPI002548F301|nr:uncharacterized protein N7471_001334 [Penicillium samsonianum]KAJ6150135.1 hypothetical protein N7471_001334 [Penicillium samsonianum]
MPWQKLNLAHRWLRETRKPVVNGGRVPGEYSAVDFVYETRDEDEAVTFMSQSPNSLVYVGLEGLILRFDVWNLKACEA